ncbi:MAG TPA: hypothetical protein VF868_06310 [Bacteroidia bacterium]|jgi:hypothetical protein
MKKTILIHVIILTANILKAQGPKCMPAQDKFHNRTLDLRKAVQSFKEKSHGTGLFHGNMFRPKFSLDILAGSGIHLMNTPEIGPIPAISVGARFKAGLVITI